MRPKPMVEIGGNPVLWHLLKLHSHHGIHDLVVCLGYKGYVIREYFASYFLHTSDVTCDPAENRMEVCHRHCEPWRVTLVATGETMQTGGRLRRVRDYLDDGTFCSTYGDALADVGVGRLLRFHKSKERMTTLTAVRPPGRFGALDFVGGRLLKLGETARVLAQAAGGADLLRPGALQPRAHEPLRLPVRPRALHELGWRHQCDVEGALRASFEHSAAASATSEAMSP